MLLVHNTLQIYVIAQNLVDFKLLVLLGMGEANPLPVLPVPQERETRGSPICNSLK